MSRDISHRLQIGSSSNQAFSSLGLSIAFFISESLDVLAEINGILGQVVREELIELNSAHSFAVQLNFYIVARNLLKISLLLVLLSSLLLHSLLRSQSSHLLLRLRVGR